MHPSVLCNLQLFKTSFWHLWILNKVQFHGESNEPILTMPPHHAYTKFWRCYSSWWYICRVFSPGAVIYQHSMGTNFLVSFTRFWTNGFHSFSSPLIQCEATLESVKQAIEPSCISSLRAVYTLVINLARSNADSSSNLGIVCPPAGETLGLAATNSTELPTVDSTLTYRDASQKWNILCLPKPLAELQLYRYYNLWKLNTNDFHLLSNSPASGSFQSILLRHKSWNSILNWIAMGDIKPSGSYNLLLTPNMCRFWALYFSQGLPAPSSQRQDDVAPSSTSLQVSSVLPPDQFGLHLKLL